MATYTLVVNTADGNSPFVSGDKESIQRFANQIKRLKGGNTVPGTNTVQVKHTAVAASAIVTCATVVANNTVTINGTALTATQHNATGTVTITASGVDLDDTVTINGFAFTAKATEDTALGYFTIAADNSSATSLGACINAQTSGLISGVVTAKVATNVVTIRAVTGGTAGNSLTFVSSDAQLAVSGSGTLTNGAAVASNQFDFTGTNTQTGDALAAALAASATSLVSGHVTGVNVAGVVTISARVPGVSGNAITIASSGATLAITGSVSRLAGGSETAVSYTY